MPEDQIRIPEDATRIRITSSLGNITYYTTAESARANLDKYPTLRDGETTWESGPTLVHVHKGGGGIPNWAVWSDGALLASPPRDGENPQRFLATEQLLRHIRRSTLTHRREGGDQNALLPAEVWMRWIDATGVDSTPLQLAVDERPVGPDQTATRILELTAHTVHCADHTTDRIWVLREKIHLPDRVPRLIVRTTNRGGALSGRTQIFTDADAALAAFTALNDHRPPVVNVPEAAERLGTTPVALRRALARAAQQDKEPYSKSVGRTRWFAPNVIEHWWHNRPGHGPGRGHMMTK